MPLIMRKNIFIAFFCTLAALTFVQTGFAQSMMPALPPSASAQDCRVTDMKIGGYVGDRIGICIEERVKKENVTELIDIFRYRNEDRYWQSEFFGKWAQGAIASYQYSKDPELLELIRTSFEEFMATQTSDGYIGNYSPDAQFAHWDIWGRKYSALALVAYYKLTGDGKALDAAKRSIAHLIDQLHEANVDIASTGSYLGMASCSILEPVVYVYELTKEEKFLDFAKEIVATIEREGSSQLITKALAELPVSQRSPHPKDWWSFENGMKAYEMMSCYVGLLELGRVLGDPLYCEAARLTAESIRTEEINVAGSGSAFECWYGGRARQVQPTYHTMETCVTFTYMQLCEKLFERTGNPLYVEEFERSMYNALFASMRNDGGMIAKYSPLEGRRTSGEEQCGMHINCCNANGPRGFAFIPHMALTTSDNVVFVNLYMPLDANVAFGKKAQVGLKMDTSFPADGSVTLEVSPDRPQTFTLALRIPQYVTGVEAQVNCEEVEVAHRGGYLYLNREWKKGDSVSLSFGLETRLVTQDNHVAVTRGPVVFARDSRFDDGDVDECLVVQQDEGGIVNAQIAENEGFAWLTLKVPAVLGTDLENPENKAVKEIRFCNFSSAGDDWSPETRYRVWIPQTLHVMTEPYRQY